jgi:hypothetical protein
MEALLRACAVAGEVGVDGDWREREPGRSIVAVLGAMDRRPKVLMGIRRGEAVEEIFADPSLVEPLARVFESVIVDPEELVLVAGVLAARSEVKRRKDEPAFGRLHRHFRQCFAMRPWPRAEVLDAMVAALGLDTAGQQLLRDCDEARRAVARCEEARLALWLWADQRGTFDPAWRRIDQQRVPAATEGRSPAPREA